MPGLFLHSSNRTEELVKALCKVLRDAPVDPFRAETVVVYSRGMERWLSFQIAQHLGICANIKFPFPETFMHSLFIRQPEESKKAELFQPSILKWRIAALLPSLLDRKEFDEIKTYCSEGGESRLFQISGKIADTFDQYCIFRPDIVIGWEDGRDKYWQAILWRTLVGKSRPAHRLHLRQQFLNDLSKGKFRLEDSYHRIMVFGISSLPQFYLDILKACSNHIDVHIFLANPCREYWTAIMSKRRAAKVIRSEKKTSIPNLHIEQGNSLLASLGEYGQYFIDSLVEMGAQGDEIFSDDARSTLLSCIQSDILNLKEPSDDSIVIEPEDNSIQIHSCHSPLREIEILYDNLLHIFETYPDIRPSDIAVMTPDISKYAPYVHAVFGEQAPGNQRIPYSIADRSVSDQGGIIDAFISLLNLPQSRMEASLLLSILDLPAMYRSFGLFDSDLPTIKTWITEAGVRWGKNAQARKELGLPEFPENTWEHGLDRLLLGYAMPGSDQHIFSDILPYDNIEGDTAEILGRFLDFYHAITISLEAYTGSKTVPEWHAFLTSLYHDFFNAADADDPEINAIQSCLSNIIANAEKAGYRKPVSFDAIRAMITRDLQASTRPAGFLGHGVTFCAMIPMRNIPFKAVCLAGMDCRSFPRRSFAPGFDLMQQSPRAGDRSLEKEDRYIFLEAVLAARKMLHISYVGQSILDNSEILPSITVCELIDYVKRNYAKHIRKPGDAESLLQIQTQHHLQAYHPSYFELNSGLKSYSHEQYRSACTYLSRDRHVRELFASPLPQADAEFRTVSIANLCSFFKKPCKYLLTKRLGIFLQEPESMVDENEPMALSSLESYQLKQALFDCYRAGQSPQNLYQLSKAAGRLPHGMVGKCLFDQTSQEVLEFSKKAAAYDQKSPFERLVIDTSIGDFTLQGILPDITKAGMLRFYINKLSPANQLAAWIEHLLYCMHVPKGCQPLTILVASDQTVSYKPVDKADKVLEELLAYYWEGLSEPLHFFPKAAFTYGEAVWVKNIDEQAALEKTLAEWQGSNFINYAESRDPYIKLAFRGSIDQNPPIDGRFQAACTEIIKPLLEHCEEVKS